MLAFYSTYLPLLVGLRLTLFLLLVMIASVFIPHSRSFLILISGALLLVLPGASRHHYHARVPHEC
jgi:hypothetical protein